MCGYIGVFGKNAKNSSSRIPEGLLAIKHRGPDSSGVFNDENSAFGFNRLAIIDLSSAANQPFENERFVLFFNGEIYNYVELKQKFNLETKTSSDTEVLFKILEKHHADLGEGINLLNGMFSILWYDKQEKELFLIRDRLGVKPLNYAVRGDTLFFGSEVKGFKHFLPALKPNHRAIVNFLVERTLDYNRETFFEDVYQLNPGCFLRASFKNSKFTYEEIRYWNLEGKPNVHLEEKEAIQKFRELFLDSVKLRMRADVPIAALLSGGLDSSAVTGAMAKLYPEQTISSISAVYTGDPYDEREYAEKVTEKYKNIEPHWIEIKLDGFMSELEKVIWSEESPIADGSMAAHFMLMREIHDLGVKVVLTGSGGDEILGGYVHTYLPAAEADELRRFKLQYLNRASLFHALPAWLKNAFRRAHGKQLRFLRYKSKLRSLQNFYEHFRNKTILSSYLIKSILHWTLPGFLHYEDRNSMAFSIEARNPFLDYRLVEFMVGLPNSFKIRNGLSKWILREALEDIIPVEVLERKDKQGFHAPIERWQNDIPTNYLSDKDFAREFSYLNLEAFQKDARMRWRIYTLWLWYKAYINQAS